MRLSSGLAVLPQNIFINMDVISYILVHLSSLLADFKEVQHCRVSQETASKQSLFRQTTPVKTDLTELNMQ